MVCKLQIMPSVIENHLTNHPDIKDVAFIGIQHVVGNEHPVAFVVTDIPEGSQRTALAQHVVELIRGIVGYFKA